MDSTGSDGRKGEEMKQLKKFAAGLLAVVMLLTTVSPAAMNAEASTRITVTFSVEKFVLGQGYVVEPTRLSVPKGATAAEVFETVMKEESKTYNVDKTWGYYVTGIEDKDRGEIKVAEAVKNAIAATIDWQGNPLTLTTVDETPDELGSGDYCSYAGWMFSINDVFGDAAMSDCVVANGDVIRMQFSLSGGTDVNSKYSYGTPVYPELADRTQATRVYGYLNEQIDADAEYLTKENLAEAYTSGLQVLTDLESTTAQVQDVLTALGVEVEDQETQVDDVTVNKVTKVTASKITSGRNSALAYLKKNIKTTYGNEWNIFTLKRAGVTGCTGIYNKYLTNLKSTLKKNKGALPNGKPTDYARVCITLTALGKNPKNFGGYNLMKKLANYNTVTKQGLNGAVFALLALDAGKYNMSTISSSSAQATRVKYVDFILSKQLSDGGFAFSTTKADADMTAMVLTSLAPYYNKYKRVKTAVDKAVEALSEMQQSNGSFYSGSSCNAESNAQVIVALSTLGINPRTDKRFVKNGLSVVDALMSFQTSTGAFKHLSSGKANALATTQSTYALVAYKRLIAKKNPLFQVK